jgi:RNA polymerase sigma-70 factor (ECF subfamily)
MGFFGRRSAVRDAPPGNASARDELYRRVADEFGPSLGRLAAAYEADPAHRDDLLQDIHIAVWRSLAGFEQRSSLRTWVYRVAHNTAASHVRRQRRARRAPLVSLDELDDVADSIDREEEVTQSVVLARCARSFTC